MRRLAGSALALLSTPRARVELEPQVSRGPASSTGRCSGKQSKMKCFFEPFPSMARKVCNIAQTPEPRLVYFSEVTHTVTLLQAYAAQRGLFARIAGQLKLDPSYVSRVAKGERNCRRVSLAIEAELKRMYASSRRVAESPVKRSTPRSKKATLSAKSIPSKTTHLKNRDRH